MRHVWHFIITVAILACHGRSFIMHREEVEETRVVKVNEGKLKGIVRTPSMVNLPPVGVYLGVPYAAPPVGSYRFMPPGSPQPWTGIRLANKFGHVCPQKLPEMSTSKMSPGRYKYLKRLLEYLKDENEDCLYLNIYAPLQEPRMKRRYPVIVYIHGESFEWNSGNPYDGSVLASYGEVIVVTLNFRLGILGFLRPGVDDKTVTNFGLLDQIAALKWIKDNIQAFGGDPNKVTLMGHDTGAACVNFLLVSPVPQGANGLFHRAILMSGTALADWALTKNPVQSTLQVSHKLNCPNTEDEMTSCLQRKRLSDIMRVNVQTDPFLTPFGPVVDGNVVPNEPAQIMGVYRDLFSRYELMYGMTETESYHLLNGVALTQGLIDREATDLLRSYMHAKFDRQPTLAMAETMRQYKEWHHSMARSNAEEYRDICLEVLSDARVGAPMVQTAEFHSAVNPQSYFYVFTHKSIYGDYIDDPHTASISGEELPYVFGVPLDESASPFQKAYNMSEKMLAEVMMTMWVNFAYSGSPNSPKQYRYLFQSRPEWNKFEVEWPEYESNQRIHLEIGLHPRLGYRYRSKMMQFWNKILPEFINSTGRNQPVFPEPPESTLDSFKPTKPTRMPGSDFYENFEKPLPGMPSGTGYAGDISNEGEPVVRTTEGGETVTGESSSVALGVVVIIGVFFLLVNLSACAALYYQRDRMRMQQENILLRRTYNNVEDPTRENYESQGDANEGDIVSTRAPAATRNKESSDQTYEPVKSARKTADAGEVPVSPSGRTWRRSRQCSTSTMDPHTKVKEWIAHEIVQRYSPRFTKRARPPLLKQQSGQQSTDTSVDQMPSTSISPVLVHKENVEKIKHSAKHDVDANTPTSLKKLQRGKVQKVSVAVDATPSARTASILRQTPIEISKSLDHIGTLCVSKSTLTFSRKPSLKRSQTTGDEITISTTPTTAESSPKENLRRSTSINFQVYPPPLQFRNGSDEELKIEHHHSRSDPVTHTPSFFPQSEQPTKYLHHMNPRVVDISLDPVTQLNDKVYSSSNQAAVKPTSRSPKIKSPKPKKDAEVSANILVSTSGDINVTSRDSSERAPVGFVDPLSNIQRRNFPKVLPDFPQDQGGSITADQDLTPAQIIAAKRLSLPHPGNLKLGISTKELCFHSQPTTPTTAEHRDIETQTNLGKVPPPPPPRISSTLGRKPNNKSPITPLHITEKPQHQSQPTKSSYSRPEPKIIIKPTSTAPVTRKPTGTHGGVPHVTPPASPEYYPTVTYDKSPTSTPENVMAKQTNEKRPMLGHCVPVAVPKVPPTPQVVSIATTSSTSSSSKQSSDTSTDESSSNTGTVKRVKKPSESGKCTPGKSWYTKYNKSILSKSKDKS